MCHPISELRGRKPKVIFECSGFSLLELLVAMALTMVVMAVAFSLFSRLYDVSETVGAISEMNQNLRASINLLARDITASGEGMPPGGIPLPSGTKSTQVNRPGPSGISPFPSPPPPVVLSAITPGYQLGPKVMGQPSDIITILAINSLSPIGNVNLVNITPSGSQITVDPSTPVTAPPSPVATGDLLILVNSNGAALAQATNVQGPPPATQNMLEFASSDPLNINQPSAANGNIASLGTGTPKVYPATRAYKVFMITYFLDTSDPAHPKLMRQIGMSPTAPASAIALDVYALQFTYDLADGITTNQRDVATPNQIRKVNIMVSARSRSTSRRTQQYFTNTMTTAVNVRNLTYVNKY